MSKTLEVIVARLKQSSKLIVWGVALVVLFAIMILIGSALIRRRKGILPSGVPAKVASSIEEISEKMWEANTQAKVEVAAARAEDKAVKTEIATIMANKDAAARRRQLIALHERMDATP